MQILISAQREIWTNAIGLRIAHRDDNGSLFLARPIIFESSSEEQHHAPCLNLELTDAQRLIDELWHCGLRPSEGTGSAGALKATETHLSDMRRITMGLLKNQGV